ncbi:MAG: SPASM domain-containing protein, partial [Lachnospiraceae bacterium]|nr:SPASM domain-containing protein [Lachnospiraceae bacterium]
WGRARLQPDRRKVDIIDFQNVMDFSDMIVREDLPDTDKKCDQPFNRLMVDCNGNVFPCCVEWGKNIRLGNIKDATLGEMWNGEKINILRKQIKEGKLCNVCKSCLNSMSDI